VHWAGHFPTDLFRQTLILHATLLESAITAQRAKKSPENRAFQQLAMTGARHRQAANYW
jgi:hypothetical protein